MLIKEKTNSQSIKTRKLIFDTIFLFIFAIGFIKYHNFKSENYGYNSKALQLRF